MNLPYIEVRGDGVAAYCCVHLLNRAGINASLVRLDRPRVPALLISQAALELMRDIFDRPRLLADRPPVRKRVVAWERCRPAVEVEHRGFVTSEQELLNDLNPGFDSAGDGSPDWIIYASNPLPVQTTAETFGTRTATAWRVELRSDSPLDSCMIESLARGWLFLLPAEPGFGWLLAVGDLHSNPLAGSRTIIREIRWLIESSRQFAAAPRLARTLAGPRWLACGSAAMGFDPICGDGTAMAIRVAILAAAVVRSALQGEEPDRLLQHYEARVRAGFDRHLDLCRQFYSKGYGGPWWESELSALSPSEHAAADPQTFQYRLRDLNLEPLRF